MDGARRVREYVREDEDEDEDEAEFSLRGLGGGGVPRGGGCGEETLSFCEGFFFT